MKKMISLPIVFLLIYSCNDDENKSNYYNLRLDNISILSQSFKNDNNEYLMTLLDSLKIIKNEHTNFKIGDKYKSELDNKINEIDSLINLKISQNCILKKPYSVYIDKKYYKSFPEGFILNVTFKENNKCSIKLYLWGVSEYKNFNGNYEQINKDLFEVTIWDFPITLFLKRINIRNCEFELLEIENLNY
jgi:hypothetical protein